MFSLPDIKSMNERAAKASKSVRQAVKTGKLDGKPLECEHYRAPAQCKGKVTGEPYFDIFSDDPKGLVSLCKHHREDYSDTPEGYFRCEECGRLMIENYTWELYCTSDGVCLNCARTRYLNDDFNWISLKKKIPAISAVMIRSAPHLIAVGQSCPSDLTFIGNAEFDSTTGQAISGQGAMGLYAHLEKAKADGYKRAVLIMDSAYQFAVSIGVYADNKKVGKCTKN